GMMNYFRIRQRAQWLDISALRVEQKQVATLAAGRSVNASVRRRGKCPYCRLVRRDHIKRRVAQLTEVDPHLRHDRRVVTAVSLRPHGQRGCDKHGPDQQSSPSVHRETEVKRPDETIA